MIDREVLVGDLMQVLGVKNAPALAGVLSDVVDGNFAKGAIYQLRGSRNPKTPRDTVTLAALRVVLSLYDDDVGLLDDYRVVMRGLFGDLPSSAFDAVNFGAVRRVRADLGIPASHQDE